MFNIEAILAKSDLVVYVERAGGVLRKNGSRYSCACPLHGGDNTTAFSIWQSGDGRMRWKCFTGECGSGDAIRFVEVWQHLDFRAACVWINGGALEDTEGMLESAKRRHEQALAEAEKAREREEARRRELQMTERHVYYHKMMSQYHREEWCKAGIDEGMQDFWTLGGCDDFTYCEDDAFYHSPTLTIPIKAPETCELLTIQHRLLNPVNPKSKYRPEKTGLRAHPFLAVPEMGFDGDVVLVMEGAKKAMVAWTRADTCWQCIGADSQEMYASLVEPLRLAGKRVVVIPDPNTDRNPNAMRKGYNLAKAIGASFLHIPLKIDDLILQTNMGTDDLFHLVKQARRA